MTIPDVTPLHDDSLPLHGPALGPTAPVEDPAATQRPGRIGAGGTPAVPGGGSSPRLGPGPLEISRSPFRTTSPPSLRGNENDTVSSVIDRKQGVSPPITYTIARTGTPPLADLSPPMKHRVSPVQTSLPIHLARDSATSLALTIIGDSAGILGRRIPSFSKQSLLSFLSRDRPSRPPVPKG